MLPCDLSAVTVLESGCCNVSGRGSSVRLTVPVLARLWAVIDPTLEGHGAAADAVGQLHESGNARQQYKYGTVYFIS